MEEAISRTEIGSTSSGKEATKHDSSIVRILAANCCTFRAIQGHTEGEMIPPEMLDHVFIPHTWRGLVFHQGCSFNFDTMLDSSQEGEKVVKPDTQCSSHHWTHGVPKKKKSIVVILRDPEKFTTKQDGSTPLDPSWESTKERFCVLANEIARNHHQQHGAT